MADHLTKLHNSLVQYGPLNRRVYLIKLADDAALIIPEIERIAGDHGYDKILAKIPETEKSRFENRGYRTEAVVPGLIRGNAGAVFVAKYFSEARRQEAEPEAVAGVLRKAGRRQKHTPAPSSGRGVRIEACTPACAEEMSRLYREVFQSYPFPIYEPDYLAATMQSHVSYYCVRRAQRMVAVASAEADFDNLCVEMTDFATRSSQRSRGLAGLLLAHMEGQMARAGFKVAFTIARALSAAMNITFSRMGYNFAGTLTNNTHIAGRIESMNVWYKPLPAGESPAAHTDALTASPR